MKAYPIKDMRNVCILGHGGSGKTSLAESMLFLGKGTDRLGKVADGNTVSDYDAEEIKRKISIGSATAPLEWKNTKINLIDTPGFLDFSGEVLEATRAADGAIITVAAKAGVQSAPNLRGNTPQSAKCRKLYLSAKWKRTMPIIIKC